MISLKRSIKLSGIPNGIDFAAWQNDEKTVDAVIRNIEVIGEASSHLPIEVQEQYEDVPWGMMKGIRNILAHEYFGIDLEIVWKTIKDDLPILKKRLL